jgi:DNA polymerase-3 subunit epsilon
MYLIGLDTETTGLDQDKGHRIVEIAIGLYEYTADGNHRQIGSTWNQLIDPKRAIDPKAEAVHGISRESLVGQPTWEKVAPKVVKFLTLAEVVVAHNAAFDIPFIVGELLRIDMDIPNCMPFCTMDNGRAATPMGNVPNLQKLCWAMDVPYDGENAHRADYDVDVMMKAYFKGLQRGFFSDPCRVLTEAA